MPSLITDAVNANVRSVAIVGGGASGAIVLDSLLKEKKFDQIVLFERRDILGGIWCLDSVDPSPVTLKIGDIPEHVDPQLENPLTNGEAKSITTSRNSQERFVQTPSYPNLKTNITETLMTYSDVKLWTGSPSEETEFVDGLVVREYIEKYILKNKDAPNVDVQFSSTVEDVERELTDNGHRYKVTIRKEDQESDVWYQRHFDAIVVTTGHYHVPFIPNVPGLAEVHQQFPNFVRHAKFFRQPDPYKDKVVIVVGSRASGMDIARLLVNRATKVYHSKRNVRLGTLRNVVDKGEIKEFKIVENKLVVVFDDDSELVGPDHIIYGTGYQFSYPFLNRLFKSDNELLTHDGILVPGLYQHTFLSSDPLISFVGVPVDGISFRVFEFQAVLVARYLAGRITLPTREEQTKWRNERYEEKGATRAYHTIGVDDAIAFMAELSRLGELQEQPIGRKFPEFSPQDRDKHQEGRQKLLKLFDIV